MSKPVPAVERIILGVDPGSTIMGYCLLRSRGKEAFVLASGVLRLSQYGEHYQRLTAIFHRLNQVVTEYRPDELAIESPFFGKNVQSMLKLGRAQGVAITVALTRGMPVQEYSPRRIKQVITGNGNASKEQVAKMLPSLTTMLNLPETLDETDALATALCHHIELQRPLGPSVSPARKAKQAQTWKQFLEQNPERLKP
ncbi:MAG: crossover junction endodeoxyribonuclease RuvC [Bacteroidetes bacterium]|nr:crossover junction endodeoxyribonuclease RuvC [Bacteroidota bacterium]